MKINIILIILSVLLFESLSQLTTQEPIKIYSKDYFKIDCDSHFFYLSMDISSSNKDNNEIIPFELTLLSPQDLKFKCIIDISKEKLSCFSFVPLGQSYHKEELFFHLFYYPPKIPGIEFDSSSFIKYSRKWENTLNCGKDNSLLNITKVDYSYWSEISIIKLFGGDCVSFYEDKEQKNIYYFNMTIGIEDEKIINNFQDNEKTKINFIQEIKIPTFLKYQKYESKISINSKEYAYCKTNGLIDINNYKNIDLTCKLNIQKNLIINSIIKISSFFDKIYIQIIKDDNNSDLENLNLFFNIKSQNSNVSNIVIDKNANTNETITNIILDDNKGNNILCPNKPIFIIKTKDNGIYYDTYSNITNRFSFYLKGTLINGYKYQNDSLVPLSETVEEISFPLTLTDNTLINSDETDTQVKCILSSYSLFNQENNTLIHCFGEKKGDYQEIDLTLNYVQKKNNNCTNIIINWPEVQYYGNKKNLYSYKLTVLSMQQKDYVCDEGIYFIFYINIYNLNKEPKLWFDLPLFAPEGIIANCELFDQSTLMCSIDLKYKKLLKDTKISLHKKGTELKLINNEGNENIFVINDFTDLGKEEHYYITMKQDCGENIILSTLQDMGISKKNSFILGICGAAFLVLLIVFCFVYIVHCFKVRCKRGKKLSMTEESRDKDI